MIERQSLMFFLGGLVVSVAQADLPLTVEDLLTGERSWRTDINFAYVNSDRRQVDSRFGLIQLGTGQFVSVPVSVMQARQNTDIFAMSIGARYGVNLNSEVFARASGIYQSIRALDMEGPSNNEKQRFSDVWFGINYRFSRDNKTPALLGFAELAVLENIASEGNQLINGKTAMFGMTSYRAIDPLVLSMTIGYRYSAERYMENQAINPGNLFFINPNLGFAVNHEVTLTSGLQWRWQQRDTVDGKNQGIQTTQTKLEFVLSILGVCLLIQRGILLSIH